MATHIPFWAQRSLLAALDSAGIRQRRFHWEGNWFHPLSDFPAALCDPHGFLPFRSREDFVSCADLVIRKDVHTRTKAGIGVVPGYRRVDQVSGSEMPWPGRRD